MTNSSVQTRTQLTWYVRSDGSIHCQYQPSRLREVTAVHHPSSTVHVKRSLVLIVAQPGQLRCKLDQTTRQTAVSEFRRRCRIVRSGHCCTRGMHASPGMHKYMQSHTDYSVERIQTVDSISFRLQCHSATPYAGKRLYT